MFEEQLEVRFFDNVSRLNLVDLRSCAAYQLTPWLRLDNRFDYIYYLEKQVLSYIPGLYFSTKAAGHSLYLRQWFEYDWNLTAGSHSEKLRTKIGVSHKVENTRLTPHLDYEIHYWDQVNQHRFFAGTRIKVSGNNSLDLYYLYQVHPLKNKGTHILGWQWTATL